MQQISGERLQDHSSSGFKIGINVLKKLISLYSDTHGNMTGILGQIERESLKKAICLSNFSKIGGIERLKKEPY